MTRVTVCVATYRRPAGLDRLLSSLAATQEAAPHVDVRVIVLDNDETGSARSVAERFRDRLQDLVYTAEPVRGISRIRNRLVNLALEVTPDYVAFLDDDEWVEPAWLKSFDFCARRVPSVWTGPVVPSYAPDVPDWIREGLFFERPRSSTGSTVRFAGAGNIFIPTSALSALRSSDPFGDIFERPGGEDALFSVLIRQRGWEIRWCNDAVVHEEVTRSRASIRWLLRRAFNGGFDYTRVVRLTRLSWDDLVRRAMSGTKDLVLGVLLLFAGIFRGRLHVVDAARRCAEGVGTLAGLVYPIRSRSSKSRTGGS